MATFSKIRCESRIQPVKTSQNLEDKVKASGNKEIKRRKGLWLNNGGILHRSHHSNYLEEVRAGKNISASTVLM